MFMLIADPLSRSAVAPRTSSRLGSQTPAKAPTSPRVARYSPPFAITSTPQILSQR
jgi:hypothetical protein